MKPRHLFFQAVIQALVLCACSAGTIADSLKSFASGKTYVIAKQGELRDGHGNVVGFGWYSPEFYKEYARINNKTLKKLVFNKNMFVRSISGPRINNDGTHGEVLSCIIYSIPEIRTIGEGYLCPDLMRGPEDYAFCEPIGEYDAIVSGTDRLAVVPKDVWFSDVKTDVKEYMERIKAYEGANPEDKTRMMLEDFKRWSDLRALAVLELLLEQPDVDITLLSTRMAERSAGFRDEAAKIVLKSNMPKTRKIAILDSATEGGWKSSLESLRRVAKMPLLPEHPLMAENREMLAHFEKDAGKENK